MINHSGNSEPLATGSGNGGMQISATTVLTALRYWWKVVTPIALILVAGVATAICYFHKPLYTAESWLIMREQPEVVLRPVQASPGRFVPTQIEIMRSPRVLATLASNPEIVATPELREFEDLPLAISRLLRVSGRSGSDFYTVAFTSESPKHAHLIVKEAVQSYLQYYNKVESERTSRTVRLLEEQRAIRFEEMNQLRENVRALSIQLTGVDPFRATVKEQESTTVTSPYAAIQADLIRQGLAQDFLAAEIKAEEEILAENPFEVNDSEVEAALMQNPRYSAVASRIEKIREREGAYQKLGKNLDNNVLYKQMQADLAENLEELESIRLELHDDIKAAVEKTVAMKRGERISQMKRDHTLRATRMKILEDKLNEEIGSVKQTAQQYTGANLDLEFRRAKLDQISKIHDELQARILAFNTELRAPERVSLFKESTVPIQPNELIPWKKIAVGSALALMIPFGLAIGWEHLCRRVASRAQLENAQQIMVVGEVTSLPSRSLASRDGDSDHNMRMFEESVDGLRTYLSLADSRNFRVIAVTSAVTREGKTSLASQLAVSIARATGELTLLIDGDMRAPDIHWIFGTEAVPGLAEVLKKEIDVDAAVVTEFSEKLHILPSGNLDMSPHTLIGSGEFSVLMEKLTAKYRHIVIDTPPVLSASEALVMARAADATVMCVRRDYSRMEQVHDAYRRMVAAGVHTLGAVINGIPIRKYVQRYGSYGYSRNG